ncbi:cytochrome-c peroxidase [Mesonia maritima]|uniref:Cytochrome c peroxidase n=1 Tax=Mesonia maritima TaxID=1793873 RepID=A0ABU1K4M1_9FLAO|nr:cytochrome c peroxidase [Mesonia maritima]MDR6300560.1 cytochrome c peroxidase [Mesonia maritima]
MRHLYRFRFFIISIIITFFSCIFSFTTVKDSYQKTSTLFAKYAKEFKTSLENLDQTAEAFKLDKISSDSLQKAVKATRLDYKKIEFYLDFHYHEFVNSHINGAPLLHIEKSGALPDVIPPEGLQVLDELVYTDNLAEEKTLVASVAKKLLNHYKLLENGIQQKNINPEEEIVAMRMQLIRIFTLGMSGFDTPGSLNALEEASVSLESIKDFFTEFSPQHHQKEHKKILIDLKNAIDYLEENNDFNTFDRYTFLIQHIEPLYEEMKIFQAENTPEFLAYSSAWNPESSSMFSSEFLNPYFFTALQENEDSPQLQKLGEKLFYDQNLSNNKQISCASCHNPNLAFSDGKTKSESNVQGKTVLRNSPSLLNSVYADRYFYDLRAFTLEQQAEHVIFNSDEFNTAYSSILKKLEKDKTYKNGFKEIFNTEEISRQQFSKALTSYVASLTSWNSKFDKYIRDRSQNPDPSIKRGFNLFTGKAACATCHFAPTFAGLVPPFYSDSESEILGVLEDPNAEKVKLDPDQGRIESLVQNEKAWIYEKSFKTTSVRNAEVTAPYFHNGAYKTLEEVIEFYNKGGGAGQGLKVTNQTLAPDELNLSAEEKKDLIAFIKSLTDTSKIQKKS